MKFYSAYDPAPALPEPECPREVPDFILDEETDTLVTCGTIPFYERIQSYHESTKLSTKLKRFTMGDTTALGVGDSSSSDFTGAPADLRQVLDARKKITEDFKSLSSELRGVFNNNFDEFEKSVREGTAERRIYEQLTNSRSSSKSGGPASEPSPAAGE